MKQEHTKGPWVYTSTGATMRSEYSQSFGIVESGQANLVAGIFSDVEGGDETAESNAKLIAASPDLLEACVNALYLATIYRKKGGDGLMVNAFQDIYMRTSKAIFKATGKKVRPMESDNE